MDAFSFFCRGAGGVLGVLVVVGVEVYMVWVVVENGKEGGEVYKVKVVVVENGKEGVDVYMVRVVVVEGVDVHMVWVVVERGMNVYKVWVVVVERLDIKTVRVVVEKGVVKLVAGRVTLYFQSHLHRSKGLFVRECLVHVYIVCVL